MFYVCFQSKKLFCWFLFKIKISTSSWLTQYQTFVEGESCLNWGIGGITESDTNWLIFFLFSNTVFLQRKDLWKRTPVWWWNVSPWRQQTLAPSNTKKRKKGDIFCANLGTIYTIICDNKFRGSTSEEKHEKVLCFPGWFRADVGKAFHTNWRPALKLKVAWEMFDDGVRTFARGLDSVGWEQIDSLFQSKVDLL